MSEVELVLLKEGEGCTVYTLQFLSDDVDEFQKFIDKVKDVSSLNSDFRQIVRVLEAIGNVGALERYFRPEGSMKDSVVALPVAKSRLRLYCLRLSDRILILGNGGVKNTRTYDEDEDLKGYVMTLQKFEALLKTEIKAGKVKLSESHIATDQIFKL